MSDFVETLATIVGRDQVLSDPELRASYEVDWTGRFSGPCRAVVRPANTEEVAATLAACQAEGVAVVPQGGNTGLVGGSVPRPGGTGRALPIVLSLRRLAPAIQIDEDQMQLRAGAGATLAAAAEAAASVGLELGIDLAARDTATLGGMVATNAGGIHVIRHGSMRRRLAGLEAVLADGTILSRMAGLWKDNIGWDLPSLLAGSEGTLAVVTGVALRMVPTPEHRVTALAPLPGSSLGQAARAAVDLLRALRRNLDGLEAVEIVDRRAVELVVEHAGVPWPPGGPGTSAWLVVEAGGNRDLTDDLARALDPLGDDIAVASEVGARRRLWVYRERVPEAIASRGIPHKLDVSVPIARLADLLDRAGEVAGSGVEVVCFGHVGDGNLHINVIGPPPDDMRVDDAVLALALELGGSISAEHGIGVAKLAALRFARSAGELDLARRVKHALDPTGILNPGVLVG